MPELALQRIPFTVDTDNQLRMLKSRTGITPNILCRIGFCLSIEETGIPNEIPTDHKLGREINRYTLLGKYDSTYVALLVSRLSQDKISITKIDEMFLAHISRGIAMLASRVKSVSDIAQLGNLP